MSSIFPSNIHEDVGREPEKKQFSLPPKQTLVTRARETSFVYPPLLKGDERL
jgi:hypothetical protein